MDIAKVSMAMSQAQLKQAASLSVMKKAMDTTEMSGDALVEMLNKSVPHPYLGKSVDVKA
ncbi:MAG TPA: YjfB family protein [Pseudogracilibacillus sp.]|nr:YjfB family protein [Pseudogracilibacillus sp.]